MFRMLAAMILSATLATTAQAATIIVLPGVGFSDSKPFNPVGGNSATTLGSARLQVFQKAASLWGARLASSQVIYISVNFDSGGFLCSPGSGMLGWARPNLFVKNFANAPKMNVYYPIALANALAGRRVDGSDPRSDSSTADIHVDFNSAVDSSPSCLNGVGFYYGLDNRPGSKIDLLNAVMHEIGHGLGFISFTDETTGQGADYNNPNQLGIYDQFIYDEAQEKYWTQLSTVQRATSATNDGHLVWNGLNVNGATSGLKSGVTSEQHLKLFAPNPRLPGSSISHWDDDVVSSFLMRPYTSATTKASAGVDVTACAMADMGWRITAGISCPDLIANNVEPVAQAQSLQTSKNTQLPLALTASDENSDPLTFSIVLRPAHGSLTGAIPNLIYVPDANYVGPDGFKFAANDGQVNSASALVSIAVNQKSEASVMAANQNPSGSSGDVSGESSGGGAMPSMLWLLILLSLRQWQKIRASMH